MPQSSKRYLKTWTLPGLVALAFLSWSMGCGKVASKAAPRAVVLVPRATKVILYEISAAKFGDLLRRVATEELTAVLAELAAGTEEVALAQLGKKQLNEFTGVYLAGDLNERLVSQLSRSNVTFVQDLTKLTPSWTQPKDVELLFVGSRDRGLFQQMYGNQNIHPILEATTGPNKIGKIVESLPELEAITNAAKANNRLPMLVFDNQEGNIRFAEGHVPIPELVSRLNTPDLTLLGCNTSEIGGLGFSSTDAVFVDSLIPALSKTKQQLPGSVSPADFLSHFASNYADANITQTRLWNAKVIGGTSGLAGGGGATYVAGVRLSTSTRPPIQEPVPTNR